MQTRADEVVAAAELVVEVDDDEAEDEVELEVEVDREAELMVEVEADEVVGMVDDVLRGAEDVRDVVGAEEVETEREEVAGVDEDVIEAVELDGREDTADDEVGAAWADTGV